MAKAKKSIVHAILECRTCGWKTESYLTAQRQAANHVKKTGHKVEGDLGYYVEYIEEEARR